MKPRESWTDVSGLTDEEIKARLVKLDAALKRRERADSRLVVFYGLMGLTIALYETLKDCGGGP